MYNAFRAPVVIALGIGIVAGTLFAAPGQPGATSTPVAVSACPEAKTAAPPQGKPLHHYHPVY